MCVCVCVLVWPGLDVQPIQMSREGWERLILQWHTFLMMMMMVMVMMVVVYVGKSFMPLNTSQIHLSLVA